MRVDVVSKSDKKKTIEEVRRSTESQISDESDYDYWSDNDR